MHFDYVNALTFYIKQSPVGVAPVQLYAEGDGASIKFTGYTVLLQCKYRTTLPPSGFAHYFGIRLFNVVLFQVQLGDAMHTSPMSCFVFLPWLDTDGEVQFVGCKTGGVLRYCLVMWSLYRWSQIAQWMFFPQVVPENIFDNSSNNG